MESIFGLPRMAAGGGGKRRAGSTCVLHALNSRPLEHSPRVPEETEELSSHRGNCRSRSITPFFSAKVTSRLFFALLQRSRLVHPLSTPCHSVAIAFISPSRDSNASLPPPSSLVTADLLRKCFSLCTYTRSNIPVHECGLRTPFSIRIYSKKQTIRPPLLQYVVDSHSYVPPNSRPAGSIFNTTFEALLFIAIIGPVPGINSFKYYTFLKYSVRFQSLLMLNPPRQFLLLPSCNGRTLSLPFTHSILSISRTRIFFSGPNESFA